MITCQRLLNPSLLLKLVFRHLARDLRMCLCVNLHSYLLDAGNGQLRHYPFTRPQNFVPSCRLRLLVTSLHAGTP
jgi:hypothetical protein